MKRTNCWLGMGLLVAVTLGLSASQGLAGDEKGSGVDGVAVVVEIWRTADAGVLEQIDATTNKDPSNASAVHQIVSATDKATRVSRFVTPTRFDTTMKHSDRIEKAVQMPARTSPGGAVTAGGFGGFTSEGTSLVFTASDLGADDGNRIQVQLDVKASMGGQVQKLADGTIIPPNRITAEIAGTIVAHSNVMRMFVSHTTGADMVLVFVTTTRL